MRTSTFEIFVYHLVYRAHRQKISCVFDIVEQFWEKLKCILDTRAGNAILRSWRGKAKMIDSTIVDESG